MDILKLMRKQYGANNNNNMSVKQYSVQYLA